MYNKKHTLETKKQISESCNGIKPSLEARKRMSLAKKGKTSWNKGLKHSPETKKRMSIAHRKCVKKWSE